MPYREVPPPGFLRGLAEGVWQAVAAPGAARAVLPDGCMDLLVVEGELLVAGPDTVAHPAAGSPTAASTAVGVRFAPGALPCLLGVPAVALRDLRVPFAEIHPRLARAAAGGLDAGAPATRVLTDVAVALLAGHDPADRGWSAAVRAAALAGTAADDIATSMSVTPRTLHRRCLREFGYGPATLRRVLRFRRAHALLLAGTAAAEVAAVAGYADQPHLSREVKALSGMAPGDLVPRPERFTTQLGGPDARRRRCRPCEDPGMSCGRRLAGERLDPPTFLDGAPAPSAQPGSGANRSTPVPSGSRTVA